MLQLSPLLLPYKTPAPRQPLIYFLLYRFDGSGHLNEWNHILCGLLGIVSFTQHHSFKVHACCSIHEYFNPFNGQIIFYCMAMPHFVYPSISRWTFELSPPFSYCDQVCCEQSRTCINLNTCFQFFRVKLQNCMVTLCLIIRGTARLFSKVAAIFDSHQQCIQVLISPHPCQHLSLPHFLMIASLVGVKYVSLWFWFAFP